MPDFADKLSNLGAAIVQPIRVCLVCLSDNTTSPEIYRVALERSIFDKIYLK